MVFHMRKKRKTKTHGHGLASEFWHQSMTRQIWINLAYKWGTVAGFMIPYTAQEQLLPYGGAVWLTISSSSSRIHAYFFWW